MTHLCVPIFVTDAAQARRDIAAAVEAGVDMVELRIDRLTEFEQFESILSAFSTPLIVTCRPTTEGGESTLNAASRVGLLSHAAACNGLVDIELETYRLFPEFIAPSSRQQYLIISSHDFQGRPEKLHNLILEMNQLAGNVNKLVWTAHTIRDNFEAFEILQQKHRPTIALCMGEAGLLSRVLAKKFGAFLTFASLGKSAETAPGQVTISDMKNLYRWDAIGPRTKVYGVVADPVMHSMSPAIHNAAFTQTGHDGVYLPMLVEGSYESFKAFMETALHCEGLDLAGLSITLPHKENALRYLKEKNADIDPLAESIGAVNTIVIESEIKNQKSKIQNLKGLNTDYPAILDSITSAMNISREQLENYRVAVIGAGGAGRAAVAALASCGATVVVYNRTKEKADALAAEFNGKTGRVVSARLDKLCDSCCHIFINTTPLGQYPNVDQSPLGDRLPKFTDETLVFDTIYNPIKTRLLRQAEQAGAKTIPGIEMFIRQAAAQFEAWTGQSAPQSLMRKVVESRLLAAK